MAIQKLTKSGYGQIELNQVAWRRDGRIEAQCALDSTEFTGLDGEKAENGMLFAINHVTRTLKKATAALAENCPIGINYSTEHIYDERTPGLKNFYLTGGENFLPRLGLPAVGDRFTTNTICINASETFDFGTVHSMLQNDTTPVYAGIATDGSGYWELFETIPAVGPVARVIEYTDMPDGQEAIKLQIIRA